MKKLFTYGLCLALFTPCLANTIPTLVIKTDASERSISLAGISKVSYTETEMHIDMRNGDKHTFIIDEIKGMEFFETDDTTSPTRIVESKEVKLSTITFRLDGKRNGGNDKGKNILIIKSDKDTRKVIK